MDYLKELETELKDNILQPNEYVNLSRNLGELGYCELSNKVLQTAAFTYRNNKGLIRQLEERGLALPPDIDRKVFVIGLSRTGTNSLSSALKEYSLSGFHWNGPNGKPILDWDEIEGHQFASDTPVSFIFESLYYAYPDAYFIYTTREVKSWVKSMENHFKWANGFEGFQELTFRRKPTPNKLINLPLWAVIHRNLYANADSWEDAYNKFDRRVKKFFSSQEGSNLLMLDVGLTDEEKWNRLSEFLRCDFVPLKPFPRKNIKLQEFESNKETIDQVINKTCSEFQTMVPQYPTVPIKDYIVTTIDKPEDLALPIYDDSNLHYAIARANGKNKNIDLIKLENAYISLDFTKKYSFKFYIFNEQQELLERISHGDSPFLLDNVIPVDKKVGFLEDKFSNFNVCHLLTDKLSRVKQLQKAFSPEEYILYHKNSYIDQAKQLTGLKTLDFEQKGYVTLKVSQLFLSSASTYTFIHPAQNLDSNFQDLKDSIISKVKFDKQKYFPEVFFIDRSSSNSRNVLNLGEFNSFLQDYKIESIKLEDLSLAEQVQLFSGARLVLGVHGAGLTNIMFCKEGTDVVEILPPLCATPAFFKIAVANKLNYRFLVARDKELPTPLNYSEWVHEPAKYNRRDIECDIEKLESIVKGIFNE